MAGDWIKMRVNLASDPAVIQMADKLDSSEHEIVGLLHAIWSWADGQTEDGSASGVSLRWVDRHLSKPGFANAMVECGWLEVTGNGLLFPGFERHNGKSAKKRAQTKNRQQTYRNAGGVTEASPEKRREEKSNNTQPTERHGKIAPIVTLLQGDYAHLAQDADKREPLKLWLGHLKQRLAKVYSDSGAKTHLKRIDEMSALDFSRAVEFSVESNYQKLVVPQTHEKRNTKNSVRSKTDGKRGFAEYAEQGGSGPPVA